MFGIKINNDMIWKLGGIALFVGGIWFFMFGPGRAMIPGQKAQVEFDAAVAENIRRKAAGQPYLTNEEFDAMVPDLMDQ